MSDGLIKFQVNSDNSVDFEVDKDFKNHPLLAFVDNMLTRVKYLEEQMKLLQNHFSQK